MVKSIPTSFLQVFQLSYQGSDRAMSHGSSTPGRQEVAQATAYLVQMMANQDKGKPSSTPQGGVMPKWPENFTDMSHDERLAVLEQNHFTANTLNEEFRQDITKATKEAIPIWGMRLGLPLMTSLPFEVRSYESMQELIEMRAFGDHQDNNMPPPDGWEPDPHVALLLTAIQPVTG